MLQSGGPLRHMRHVLQIRITHVCDMMRSGGALTGLSVIPDVGLGGSDEQSGLRSIPLDEEVTGGL